MLKKYYKTSVVHKKTKKHCLCTKITKNKCCAQKNKKTLFMHENYKNKGCAQKNTKSKVFVYENLQESKGSALKIQKVVPENTKGKGVVHEKL